MDVQLHPLRLSYQGGGEFLQTLGVGVILPCLGYSAQAGSLAAFSWPLLAIILPTQLACAISTAIPDHPSDGQDNKRTTPVLLGILPAKGLVIMLHLATAIQLLFRFGILSGAYSPTIAVSVPLIAALALVLFIRSTPGSRSMLAFTFLSVLATLSSMAALIIAHWR